MPKRKPQPQNKTNLRITIICASIIALIALILFVYLKPETQPAQPEPNEPDTQTVDQTPEPMPKTTHPIENQQATVLYIDDDNIVSTEATILSTGDTVTFRTADGEITKAMSQVAIRVKNPNPPDNPYWEYSFGLKNFGETDFNGDVYDAIEDTNCTYTTGYIIYTQDYIYETADTNAFLINLDPADD